MAETEERAARVYRVLRWVAWVVVTVVAVWMLAVPSAPAALGRGLEAFTDWISGAPPPPPLSPLDGEESLARQFGGAGLAEDETQAGGTAEGLPVAGVGAGGSSAPAVTTRSAPPVAIRWISPAEGAAVAAATTVTVESSFTAPGWLQATLDTTDGPVLGRATSAVGPPLVLQFVVDPKDIRDGTHHLIATGGGGAESEGSSRRTVRIDARGPTVKALSVSPAGGLYPGKRPGDVTARFRIDAAGSQRVALSVVVRTRGGAVLLRRGQPGPTRGSTGITWNGRDSRGSVVKPGVYVMAARVTDDADRVSPEARAAVRIIGLTDVAKRFDGRRALNQAKAIARYGPRRAGTAAERRAATYAEKTLRGYGLRISRQGVPLWGGGATRNVVARKPSARSPAKIVVIGAHVDSIVNLGKTSPGGNDDASGMGVLLEAARVMSRIPMKQEIRFVAFGGEERIDGNPDHHHAGSRFYVAQLGEAERAQHAGMVNLDMVGVGDRMGIGTQSGAPQTYARFHLATARKIGYTGAYVGHGAGSDHEAFVKARIPVAYYDRRPDPHYHTPQDTVDRLDPEALAEAGRALVASLFRLAAI